MSMILHTYTTTTTSTTSTTSTTTAIPGTVIYPQYGFLYNFYAATSTKEIANTGWHLPSTIEYDTLLNYISAIPPIGNTSSKLRQWDCQNLNFGWAACPDYEPTNQFNFNERGSGYRSGTGGSFSSLHLNNYFWTSNQINSTTAYTVRDYCQESVSTLISLSKKMGVAIRLVKDSTLLSHGQSGVYIGNDNKCYSTICIGTQEWLADSLCETKYRDGTNIPEVTDSFAWRSLSTGAFCAYDNNWNNAFLLTTTTTTAIPTPHVGLLYNGYTVLDSRHIANTGWSFPTNDQMAYLCFTVGGSGVAGTKFRTLNNTDWCKATPLGTNETGFSVKGSGWRSNTGEFLELFRTSKIIFGIQTYADVVHYDYINVTYASNDISGFLNEDFKRGSTIRLVKDSTTLSPGQTGTYVGNDGKTYNTICVDYYDGTHHTYEWMSENLAETKYRNGDSIPEVTDNTAWAALTTGALCAYDNNWNYV